ncbi:MAG: membrane protein insertion efficiency factor YidD [Deltaproteobacteria bacterium]|nr:membrane protein insertion efficiency factor YidD [Deltaproteobacteria bacterium]
MYRRNIALHLNVSLILILLCALSVNPCYCEEIGFDPWNFNHPVRKDALLTYHGAPSFPAALLIGTLRIFSEYISPVDGERCQMYPTCVAYARQAIGKHGFLMGWMMTVDRLLHESDETDFASVIKAGDRYRYHDPVENNDFWWYSGTSLTIEK